MKVHFKFSRTFGGKSHLPGIHEIDESLKDNWFLKGLLASGDAILILDEAELVSELLKEPEAVAEPEIKSEPVIKKPKGKKKKGS
jgi:hypothetical protein